LEVRDLVVWFPIRRGVLNRPVGWVRAVDGVSLFLEKGETLALVGESGCGKTTLGRTVCGLEKPRSGETLLQGEPLWPRLRERAWRRKAQMVFQDPNAALNPRMTVMDTLTEGMEVHGLLGEGREAAARRLLSEVGLDPASLFRYPHEFSGGQRQRICIARALSLEPELVVCDEAVSALDVSVRAQILKLLAGLQRKRGLAYLFITHDLAVARHIAGRVSVMYLGVIVETGPAREVLENPRHPYTRALVSAVPVPRGGGAARIVLEGDPPSPAAPPSGCRFHTRCPHVMDVCRTTPPEARRAGGVETRCWLG
jgi:oligopeptide/dipeptide ABC transporter ATP-binding protein